MGLGQETLRRCAASGAGVLQSVPAGKETRLAGHGNASIVQRRMVAMLSRLFGGLGALLAACIPARRALRVDPIEALRYE